MRLKKIGELAMEAGRNARFGARLLCWEGLKSLKKSVTVRTRQGVFTVLTRDIAIGRSLYARREYEADEIAKSMAHLRQIKLCPPAGQGTLLDVGANIGVVSIGMLHTGEIARAVAVEPAPDNFALLQHNAKQNGVDGNLICLQYAVSDRKGALEFELSDDNFGDHRVHAVGAAKEGPELYRESGRQVIQVQTETLDQLVAGLPETYAGDIVALWIDVQGFEGPVFRGAKALLERGVPVISEVWPYGIRRMGMSQEEFCRIAEGYWSHYWVMRRGRFIRYPMSTLPILFDELGGEGGCTNVIFTR